jgi:hypothetical protein
MAESKSQIYKVKMGGLFFAFRASKNAYKGINAGLGVLIAKDTDDNLAFGAAVRPPRVRINLANGSSIIRYCDPGKLEELITKGSLNKRKFNGQNINSVRIVQS